MATFGPGKWRRSDSESGRVYAILRLCMHLHTLVTKGVHAGSPMIPPTLVLPEQRSRTDDHWMQHHADLTRFGRRPAIPLTLPA